MICGRDGGIKLTNLILVDLDLYINTRKTEFFEFFFIFEVIYFFDGWVSSNRKRRLISDGHL